MSRGDRRKRFADGWAARLGEGPGEITELEKVVVPRVDGVEKPASGLGMILIQSLAAPSDPVAELRARTGAMLARRDYQPYDLVARSHRPEGGRLPTALIKSELDQERRYSLSVAYPVWKADVAVAADMHQDVAPADVIQDAAWNFMTPEKGRQVGLWHADGTAGPNTGTVVESYLWPADPWVVKGVGGETQTVWPGDWLVGVVWSDKPGPGGGPSPWDLVKSGRIRGLSMQGYATRRPLSDETKRWMRERGAA